MILQETLYHLSHELRKANVRDVPEVVLTFPTDDAFYDFVMSFRADVSTMILFGPGKYPEIENENGHAAMSFRLNGFDVKAMSKQERHRYGRALLPYRL